jgi:hypothetical protein
MKIGKLDNAARPKLPMNASSCITLPENDNCPTKLTLRGICTKVQEGTSLGI